MSFVESALRKFPKCVPAGWVPPVPAWPALGPHQGQLIVAYYGVQSIEGTRSDELTHFRQWLSNSLQSAGDAARYVVDGNVSPGDVLGAEEYDPLRNSADVGAWLSNEKRRDGHQHHGHHHHDVNRHGERIRAHCIVLDEPVEEAAFVHWLG